MIEQTVLNEEGGNAPAPANLSGGVAAKDNVGIPAVRRKELEDSVAKAKESAHRMVKVKDSK